MSHAPERKEKNCLNCGTVVQGRYCQQCGQENIVPKESFWHLVTHFFYDITHFDTKFFESLRYLFFKPGFLSKQYMLGKRAKYLNPVRMYVFTSAFFFLIFFSFFKTEKAIKIDQDLPLTSIQRDSIATVIKEKLSLEKDDADLRKQLNRLEDKTKDVSMLDLLSLSNNTSILSTTGKKFKSFKEYDSAQQMMPADARDGWMSRTLNYKGIELNNKYAGRPKEALKEISENILHKLPYLLFVSLPIFALLLKLLYIRRKQFFYADHAIFSIHHYIFSFLNLLFVFLFNKLKDITGFKIFNYIIFLLIIFWFFYLYKGMRNFYQQGRFKTVTKFLLLQLLALIINIILLAIFFFLSIFTV